MALGPREEAIRDRLKKAEPGPWYWEQQKGHGADCYLYAEKRTWSPLGTLTGAGFPTCDFIANSHSDITYLLSRLDQIEKIQHEEWKQFRGLGDIIEKKRTEVVDLTSKVEEARKFLKAIQHRQGCVQSCPAYQCKCVTGGNVSLLRDVCSLCKSFLKADLCVACVYDTEAGEEIEKLRTELAEAKKQLKAKDGVFDTTIIVLTRELEHERKLIKELKNANTDSWLRLVNTFDKNVLKTSTISEDTKRDEYVVLVPIYDWCALKNALTDLESRLSRLLDSRDSLRRELMDEMEEVVNLQEALEKYGVHAIGCGAILQRDKNDPYWIQRHPCTCGLDAKKADSELRFYKRKTK